MLAPPPGHPPIIHIVINTFSGNRIPPPVDKILSERKRKKVITLIETKYLKNIM
jgi:hypothetical protein